MATADNKVCKHVHMQL